MVRCRLMAACTPHYDEDHKSYFTCEGGTVHDLSWIHGSAYQLKISNITVRNVTKALFSPFAKNLVVLICNYCDIVDMENGVFSNFEKLAAVDFSYNKLKKLAASWLGSLFPL